MEFTTEATYDIVIVGAGVAGCVLASRISQQRPDLQILLIEAGVEHDDRTFPAMGIFGGLESNIEWNYRSEPQESFNGETVCLTSGKIVGGSSALNYQAITRGPAVDYNQWAEIVGDKQWSWDNILPYFKKTETWTPSVEMVKNGIPTKEQHGTDGPIQVTHVTSRGKPSNYPLREKLRLFHEILGQKRIIDMNSGYPLGYCEAAYSNKDGLRSFAINYKFGDNVTLWSNATVEKVVLNGKEAEGVLVSRETENSTQRVGVRADKEVILSAGAQASPKILMLSGIGPTNELQKHNIAQIADLPVGENYVDQPQLLTYWTINESNVTLDDVEMQTSECDWLAGMSTEWIGYFGADEKTLAKAKETLSPEEYQQYTADGKVQSEIFSVYGAIDTSARKNPIPGWPGKRTISIMSILVDPLSRGTIKLRSTNPFDPPILDPKLLSSPIDQSALYENVRSGAAAVQAIPGLGAVELGVDDSLRDNWSDEAIRTRLQRSGGTLFHTSGTCAMGSVVDSECRVMGIDSLKVVDTSIFPIPIAAHYQAPTYAVAERAADIIIKPYLN